MATYSKGNAILEILKGELKNLNLSRLKIMAHMFEAIISTQTNCLWRLCEFIPLKDEVLSINTKVNYIIVQ